MSAGFPFFLGAATEELQGLGRHWVWLVGLGGALIVVGLLAIAFPIVATLRTVQVVGILLLCGAGVEVASAIWARRWRGFLLHLLTGLLYLFVGLAIVDRPALGAEGYTLMLAVFFVAGGLVRIFMAVSQRFHGWPWQLLSGAVTLLLGILIWRQLPVAALWVIGTFVGLDLMFNGWSWVMLGLAVRQLAAPRTA